MLRIVFLCCVCVCCVVRVYLFIYLFRFFFQKKILMALNLILFVFKDCLSMKYASEPETSRQKPPAMQ